MLKFCSLYSGSTGNSLFVQSDKSKILIDAGESCKKIEEALNNINIDIKDIDAILVTHEHSDHIKGIGTISKKYDIPIYANNNTWDNMQNQKSKISLDNIKNFNNNTKFTIKDLTINPFSIPHDASDPCGFNICNNKVKISIATDIGHITEDILYNLQNSSFVLLESNYDPEILKCSSYPYILKRRISGPNGHLSNDNAGDVISYLMNYGLKSVMLGHLSKENNFPELAYKTVVEKIIENKLDESSIKLNVAKRDKVSNFIEI